MDNNFLDLEDKINLIYDFLYNLNTKNCFSFDKISLGKIDIDAIKVSHPEYEANTDAYNYILREILASKFKITGYDDELKQITIKRYSNQFPVSVKVNFYPYELENIDTFDCTINNDSLFSYLLSQLVLGNKTKHILLPVINIDTDITSIEPLCKNDPLYDKLKNALKLNLISEKCCLQLREHFFKSVSLEEYLSNNICSYKGLLFQIIHTLAVIQDEFEGFRHNNLVLKNIVLYLKKISDTFTEYSGFGQNHEDKFYLPNYGFDVKITNFENAVIPKYYGSFNTSNEKIKFADKPNPYYDLYVFLNDLLEGTTQMALNAKQNSCDKETQVFLQKVIPPHIRGLSMANFNKNMVIAKPIDLLRDAYFDEFRKKPVIQSDIKDNIMSNHQYLTSKKSKKNIVSTFMDSDNYSVLGNQKELFSRDNIMHDKVKNKKNNKIFEDIDDSLEFTSKREIKSETEYDIIKINRKSHELKGGSMEKSAYRTEKNTPFISNAERETNKKRLDENPIREPPVLLEQKIYDTTQKSAPQKSQFPPTFIPLYDQEGEVMNHLLPYKNAINQPPIQKVYNINLQNQLSGNHSLSRIYEDMLPGNPYSLTAISVNERKQLIDFFRNSILDSTDGEEMVMSGGKNSLLSYIKVLDINPYSTNNNPYHDLPRNFILYRAGYPVRYDEKSKTIGLSKQSMGINVRMYMMSQGDINCIKINNRINEDNFDLWREIKYYDWVKNILSKKVSPNFISPILYKIDSESKINWSQIDIIKSKGIPTQQIINQNKNRETINNLHNLDPNLFQGLIPRHFGNNIKLQKSRSNKADLTISAGKTLILLTEAPTTSFMKWSSIVYDRFGSVNKMISTGHHNVDVWKSILFQLVYTMTILQEQKIYIKNFSLENNVFIKDIFFDSNAIGSWIYKVDNIDYYIPNYGYILMVDSKYTDIDPNEVASNPNTQIYKIYGSLYGDSLSTSNLIESMVYIQFKELINPDNFTHSFRVKGCSIPDSSIIGLLKSIHDDLSTQKIRDFIPKYFGNFVHNRIGTLLLKSEKDNVYTYSRPNFLHGNLMVWEKRFNEYEWVIYIGDATNNSLKKSILTKTNKKYEVIDVFVSSLFGYPENEPILPEGNQNMKYDAVHIYETYNLADLN